LRTWEEFVAAVQAASWVAVEPVLAPAMSVESRGTVWAHDPQVLEAVIRGDAIDVVED
jgi:hypothetical protein